MPTNILRKQGVARAASPKSGEKTASADPRRVLIRIGRQAIRAELLSTPTADRIWAALPLHSTAMTWGRAIHFETPVESGREPAAQALVGAADIGYWCEEDRVIIAFGATPISRPGERRLPTPCNVWAKALDDTSPLQSVVPGEKVVVSPL